jgi:hypothetical protein
MLTKSPVPAPKPAVSAQEYFLSSRKHKIGPLQGFTAMQRAFLRKIKIQKS